MTNIPQSTSYNCLFKAYLASDHVSEATTKTIAITISKNGGAFGNPNAGATNATEISSGWYKVALDTTDTNTLGALAVRGAAATIDDVGVLLEVVSATSGGYTNLDAAVTSRMATYTQPTGFLAATFPSGTVANTTNITAGTITTTTNLTNAPTAGDLTATMKTSVTTAATAATPTIAGTQTFNNTGTWTGNVTGNLSGSVGSVTGAVGSVTGAVGSVTARVTANTDQFNGDATSAANIAKTTKAIGRCTASGVPTTTSIPTSACTPAGAAADQFKGRIITFDADTTTTALRGQATDITASSNSATPTFTVTALTTAPASGDTFSIT